VPQISVVNYGVGNLRSVKRGLERAGAQVLLTRTAKDLARSDAIVLPGVGAFDAAMENLAPLSASMRQAAENGKPVLGICLGLQLLFTRSEEGGLSNGLDLISGNVVKLRGNVKVPHMGWNTVKTVRDSPLLNGVQNGSYFYFAHSYLPEPLEKNVVIATTDYGVRFPSIVSKRNLFATQFHPEKSGKTGSIILSNFVNSTKR
jgi:glutamine amidotransferase